MWHLCREMSEEDYFIIVSVIEKNGIVIDLAVPFCVVDVI